LFYLVSGFRGLKFALVLLGYSLSGFYGGNYGSEMKLRLVLCRLC